MEDKKRLIEANALMDAFRSYMVERYDKEKCVSEENCKTCENSCLWRKIVSVAPTVDAVEVVHGRWFDPEDDGGGTLWYCNQCHKPVKTFCLPPNYNYCPNCGAKMDGGNEDV